MDIITTQIFSSPFGELLLGEYRNTLCLCDWQYRSMRKTIDRRICGALSGEFQEGESGFLDDVKQQLQEYARGSLKEFQVPLTLAGTDFQKSVWNALLTIPYGETSSYLELSKKLGNEKAVRAVAAANGANAISIIIPCHRVIGSSGELVGYAGGIPVKKRLLALESGSGDDQLGLFT